MAKDNISADERKKIVSQAIDEIEYARKYKRDRITSWHINESLLSNEKKSAADIRANVGVAQAKAQGFVSTLQSKVDAAPNIKFDKRKDSELSKAKNLTGLFQRDMSPQNENLAFKDLLGKWIGIIYGRSIYEYHASSKDGYSAHLSLTSPYDFLIDPMAGGLDIENADFLGRGGIWKSKWQLKKEQKNKKTKYDQTALKKLLEGDGDSTRSSEEEREKSEAKVYLHDQDDRVFQKDNKYLFFEWYTTYKGERYYLLLNEDSKTAIRACKMKDIFPKELYPFWTWATNPSPFEFWTPGALDQVREIFMAQGKSINQLIDNAEQINRPMKGVVADSIRRLSDLSYGRDKIVPFKKGTDMRQAVKVFETSPISTPIDVYNQLESIGNIESGVTADIKGASDEDKVGIYEGNLANVSDRLGLLNKSYSNGYHRFAQLYKLGVEEHMTKQEAVQVLGPDGVEYKALTKEDVSGEMNIVVEAADAELNNDIREKRNKLQYLQSKAQDPNINQKTRFEMEAQIAGFSQDEIQRLLQDEFADAELMSEAARDAERLLAGEEPDPNDAANNAYRQYLVDYLRDHKEDMEKEIFDNFVEYLEKLRPIVTNNTQRMALRERAKRGQANIDALSGVLGTNSSSEAAQGRREAVPGGDPSGEATVQDLV